MKKEKYLEELMPGHNGLVEKRVFLYFYKGERAWIIGPEAGTAPFYVIGNSFAVTPDKVAPSAWREQSKTAKQNWVALQAGGQIKTRCPAPTTGPTFPPSATPTGTPTLFPTFPPSTTPTPAPTTVPTLAPTSVPTAEPTGIISVCPFVRLEGIKKSSPVASFAGSYRLLPKSKWHESDMQIGDKGVTDSDMPVYQLDSDGGTSYIYYRWQEGLWAVGLKPHGKHYRLAAKANSIEVYGKRPDMATGGWSLFYGDQPEWAPQVKCSCLMPSPAPTEAPTIPPTSPPTVSHTPSPTPAPAAAVVGIVHFSGELFPRTSEFKAKNQLAFRLGLAKSVGVPLGQVQLLMITQAYYMGGSASGIDVNYQVWPGASRNTFSVPGGGALLGRGRRRSQSSRLCGHQRSCRSRSSGGGCKAFR
jgi:hypothetical protein